MGVPKEPISPSDHFTGCIRTGSGNCEVANSNYKRHIQTPTTDEWRMLWSELCLLCHGFHDNVKTQFTQLNRTKSPMQHAVLYIIEPKKRTQRYRKQVAKWCFRCFPCLWSNYSYMAFKKCWAAIILYAFGQSVYTYVTGSSYRTDLDPTLQKELI